jgi:hypothetical protein
MYAYMDKNDKDSMLLSGYMIYNNGEVENTYKFCCGLQVNVFRSVLQYLAEMELAFKTKLSELFRPAHLDADCAVPKRRKVEPDEDEQVVEHKKCKGKERGCEAKG